MKSIVASDTRHTDAGSLNRSPVIWLWIVLLLVLVSAASLRAWQNHQRKVSYRPWHKQFLQIIKAGPQAQIRLQSLWNGQKGPDNMTQAEVERRLNDGEPFILTRMGDTEVAMWTDARRGWGFRLTFLGGKWSNFRVASAVPAVPPRPTVSTFDELTEAIRWQGSIGSTVLWGLLLMLSLGLRHYRMVLGQLLLAAALVSFTAWLVRPNYILTSSGIFSNDRVFLGMFMLALSTMVIVWAVVEDRRRPPLMCPDCEYNLKANVTGTCPECGNPIPQELQSRIQAAGVSQGN